MKLLKKTKTPNRPMAKKDINKIAFLGVAMWVLFAGMYVLHLTHLVDFGYRGSRLVFLVFGLPPFWCWLIMNEYARNKKYYLKNSKDGGTGESKTNQ